MKARRGNFFEDFSVGQTIRHATPRTVHGGDLSVYIGLTGDRRPINSSTQMAKSLGYQREVVHDLLVFHIVFGKTVGDVSLNAVANLGYADVRFCRPVYPGNTLRAETEIIGLRETSNGKTGIVYVRTHGLNEKDQEVLRFCRWVLVRKRDPETPTGHDSVPALPEVVPADELPVPPELNLSRFTGLSWAFGDAARWDEYEVGERIDHFDAMTIDETDHTTATRLYQNSARVHFDQHKMASSRFGRRLMYGGHVMSVAHALSFNGLENALCISAFNSGAHANPTFGGDTLYAWTEVLDKQPVGGRVDLGALRLRMVAVKNADPSETDIPLKVDDKYHESVVLDLDYWVLMAA